MRAGDLTAPVVCNSCCSDPVLWPHAGSIVNALQRREMGGFSSYAMQRRHLGGIVREKIAESIGRAKYEMLHEERSQHPADLRSFAVFDRNKRFHQSCGIYEFHLREGGVDLSLLADQPEERARVIAASFLRDSLLPRRSHHEEEVPIVKDSITGFVSFFSFWAPATLDNQCGVPRSEMVVNGQEEIARHSFGAVLALARPEPRKQQRLRVFSARSGRQMFSVPLDVQVKYQDIGWNKFLHTVWCMSSNGKAIIIFGVQPFRLLAKFRLTEEAFGPLAALDNVSLSMDVLCLSFKNGRHVLYALDDLIRRFTRTEPAMASTPSGYKDTLEINERVACLRSERCANLLYYMPYIITEDFKEGWCRVLHLPSNEEVDLSALTALLPKEKVAGETFLFEERTKLFFYDHMAHLMLQTHDKIHCFAVRCSGSAAGGEGKGGKRRKVELLFTIDAKNPFQLPEGEEKQPAGAEEVRYTSSGRVIPSYAGSGTQVTREPMAVDYEDDLDALTVTMRKGCFVYSNRDGRFLRFIPLAAYWAAPGINIALLDCHYLVLLTGKEGRRGSSGGYCYRAFRLQYESEVQVVGEEEREAEEENRVEVLADRMQEYEAVVDAFDGENDSDFDPHNP